MDRKKVGLSEALRYFRPKHQRPSTWNHRETWTGPCLICGGDDRAAVNEDNEGRAVFFCRHPENHPGAETPGYWFADNIVWLAFGEWIGDERFDPRLSGDERAEARRHFVQTTGERGPYIPKEPEPPTFSELEQPAAVTMADVEIFSLNTGPTFKYFGQFGLSEKTLHQFKIGWTEKPPHCALPAGYSIPNISLGPGGKLALRSIQFRRDEEFCTSLLKSYSADYINKMRHELFDHWMQQIVEGKADSAILREPTESDLINWLWHKYTYVKGCARPGVWGDDLVTLPGRERVGPRLAYIFVTEDAKSAMVLRQEGYPAVAYKPRSDWNHHLSTVFEMIPSVYIIADRDEKYNNAGKGWETAQMVERCILNGKRSRTQIVMPPAPHNDPADLVKACGFPALHNWLASSLTGTVPILDTNN